MYVPKRQGAAVAQWERAGLQVNKSNDRSCAGNMVHKNPHQLMLSPLQYSFTVKNRGLKTDSFHQDNRTESNTCKQNTFQYYP